MLVRGEGVGLDMRRRAGKNEKKKVFAAENCYAVS